MIKYTVDLQNLPLHDRAEVVDRLDKASFLATGIITNGILTGAEVYWDSAESFQTSTVYPKGCPCKQVGD